MGDVSIAARLILEEFGRSGTLSDAAVARAGWEERPERVTPALVLVFAAKILVQLREEDGETFPVDAPAVTSQGLGADDVATMISALTGDLHAVEAGRLTGLFSLLGIVAVLVALTDAENIRGEDLDRLMGAAEEIASDFVRMEDPFRLVERGVEIGPWDASETGWQGIDLIDLGGLRIPREPGLKIQLNEGRGSSDLLEAVVLRGATGVQLQAFHASQDSGWARAREILAQRVRGLGGEVREWAGRAGIELRCDVPVQQDRGFRRLQTIRMLGCDGPGWLLRATVTGEAATSGSHDDWVYSYVERVVVVPLFQCAMSLPLSATDFGSGRPWEDGQPIRLRMPG
ncbi:DUF3710 domain-containing protein [Kitasatospora sp. NPDC028055]|uniref:DUF3710 domain-containing protein n=1 Tax=Kitasatospora sp. NPDC028055 TaxID=3155653 RepID=UPI0033DCB190